MHRTIAVAVGLVVFLALLPLMVKFGGNDTEQAKPAAVGATTPLHTAAAAGDFRGVVRELAKGANPNAVDEKGRTALHLSAEQGHPRACAALIHGGADPNAVDGSGKRALDLALARGRKTTAEVIQPYTAASPEAKK